MQRHHLDARPFRTDTLVSWMIFSACRVAEVRRLLSIRRVGALAAADACMTVTDPPFCLILGVGSILHIVAGSRGLRGAPRRSTTTLFFIGLAVDLIAIPFWK